MSDFIPTGWRPISGLGVNYITVGGSTYICVVMAIAGTAISKIKIGMPYTGAGAGDLDIYATGSDGKPTGSSLATKSFTAASQAMCEISLTSALTGLTNGGVYAFRFKATSGQFGINGCGNCGNASMLVSLDSGSTWSWANESAQLSLAIDYNTGTYVSPRIVAAGAAHGYTGGIALYNVSGSRVARGAMLIVPDQDMHLVGVSFGNAIRNTPSSYQMKAEICDASSVLATSVNTQDASLSNYRGGPFFFTPYALTAGQSYYISYTPNGANDGADQYCPYFGNYESKVAVDVTEGIIRDYYYSTGTSISWTKSNGKSNLITLLVTDDAGGGSTFINHGLRTGGQL